MLHCLPLTVASTSPKEQTSSLSSLPLELQTHILYYLDFEDVLRIRQVCRALSSATHQRSLWFYILCNPPPPMDLYSYLVEKKLEMCTSSDLEAIVTNCLLRHRRWGDPSSVRARILQCQDFTKGSVLVIPGGRWAIAFASSGDAFAVDLHTPDHRSSILFRNRSEVEPTAIATALQTPEAGFQTHLKMAVFSMTSRMVRIRVWLVCPVYDSAGHVDGLKADLLSSFSGGPHPFTLYHSISGSFLAYFNFLSGGPQQAYGVIIDWEKADGQEDYDKIPKYVVPFHARLDQSIFRLLPNNILLTNSKSSNGYELRDLATIGPVFRCEDAADVEPICQGGPAYPRHPPITSPPVYCRDGRTWIAAVDSQLFKRDIVSVHGIRVATVAPIPLAERDVEVLGRACGIDKYIEFHSSKVATTIKAPPSGSPRSCSMATIEIPEDLGSTLSLATYHIDSFSGLVLVGTRLNPNRDLLDFVGSPS